MFIAKIYTSLDREVVLLQLCRWKFSHKKICSSLYLIKLEFYSQKWQICFLSHPLEELKGNVRISFTARWKERGRLPIRGNWTFIASCYGSDVISRYWSKSAFSKGGWVTLSADFRWKETSPTNLCWCQKTRAITLSCDIEISAVFSFVSSQSTSVRDRRTDRRKELRSPRPR